MTTFRRWCVVAALVAAVVALPVVVRSLPVAAEDVSAADLLADIEDSADVGYSGYVETLGSLDLPVADRFTDVAALFGERTRLRVWWRSADAWRVDKLLTTGETDLVHDRSGTVEWSYERDRAEYGLDPVVRLPRTADLAPPAVAERLLRDVDPDELSRLPPQSSVDHVDVWADRETGVPLLVEVYGAATEPAFRTEFRDFSDRTPSEDDVTFEVPEGADVDFDGVLDIADAASQFAPVVPPPELAGLTRSSGSVGAVGIYGVGVTRVLAIPLRGQEAGPLRQQLRTTFGNRQVDRGIVVTIGPLGVLVTGECEDDGWLVTGTVTEATLLAAADRLAVSDRTPEVVPRS